MSNGDSEGPERRTVTAERLVKLEIELTHLTDSIKQLLVSFEGSAVDSRRVHQTVTELISSVHNQSGSLADLKADVRSLHSEMQLKANSSKVDALELRIDSHDIIITRASAILGAVEWLLKIGGPVTFAGVIYWFFTGELPGG